MMYIFVCEMLYKYSLFSLDLTKSWPLWHFFSGWLKLYKSDYSKTTDPHDLLHSINNVFEVLYKYSSFNLGPVNSMVAMGNFCFRNYKLA